MALPRALRLPIDREVILLLQKSGKRINHPFLRALYLPNRKRSRFAVIISSQVSKKATVRNKLRRIIYEALSLYLSQDGGVDMIIYPKRGIVELDKSRIEGEVTFLFKKIQVSENDFRN